MGFMRTPSSKNGILTNPERMFQKFLVVYGLCNLGLFYEMEHKSKKLLHQYWS